MSRVLAISFLVIAFSKPYIPSKNTKNTNNIFLYIDNSNSMDVNFGSGKILNIAKNKAIQIVDAYPDNKNFYLLTNNFFSKHTSSYTKNEIKSEIEKIEPSARQRSISDIISRKNNITPNNSHLYFISDLQQNTLKLNELNNQNTNNYISLIKIPNKNTKNISIDSLSTSHTILTSEKRLQVDVKISNTSDIDIENEIDFL